MPTELEWGPEFQRLPRTISFQNWPFLALIMIIAGAASVPMAMDGNWKMVAIIVVLTAIFPAFYALMQLGTELLRRPVDTVHQNGLVWRQLWRRGFIPWADIASIELTEQLVQGVTIVSWNVHTRVRGLGALVILDGVGATEAVARVEARLALQQEQ